MLSQAANKLACGVLFNREVALDHIAPAVHFRFAADDDCALGIAARVPHFALAIAATEYEVIAVEHEPDGNNVRIAVRADGREARGARLAQECADTARENHLFLTWHIAHYYRTSPKLAQFGNWFG